jgi:single-stranded DNA-specific DHH superfamily exonuclease
MSNTNTDTVIFSDEDTDGMMATRIIHNAVTQMHPKATHTVMWQDWDIFGMTDSNVSDILDLKPATVFILDIGSGMDMLNYATAFLANGINTIILDNHPPDPEVEDQDNFGIFVKMLENVRAKFVFPNLPFFYYESSTENCTTGIAYNFVKKFNWPLVNMDKWALIGLEGDVATETKEGGPLFQELLDKHPSMRGLLASKALNSSYDWSILAFYAQLFHNPRRMIYNKAPPVCYEAMKEMEQIPNWLGFYEYVNKEAVGGWTVSPNLKMLLELTVNYRKNKGDVEKRGNYTQLDYPDFGVTIISHKWNMGSALCSKLSNANHKTWFVINNIPEYGVHVSGRGGRDGKLHIGRVFRCANPAIMEGGGIKPAGSAKTHTNNIEAILDDLVRSVELSKG